MQSAMEMTVNDEKAEPLLQEAEKKFWEIAAHGESHPAPYVCQHTPHQIILAVAFSSSNV